MTNLLATAAVLAAAAAPSPSPSEFTTKIDNPYWPMRPGARTSASEGG